MFNIKNVMVRYWYLALLLYTLLVAGIALIIYRKILEKMLIIQSPQNLPSNHQQPEKQPNDSKSKNDSSDHISENTFSTDTSSTQCSQNSQEITETIYINNSFTKISQNPPDIEDITSESPSIKIVLDKNDIKKYERMMIEISLYVLFSLDETSKLIEKSRNTEYLNILSKMYKNSDKILISPKYHKKSLNCIRRGVNRKGNLFTAKDLTYFLEAQIKILKRKVDKKDIFFYYYFYDKTEISQLFFLKYTIISTASRNLIPHYYGNYVNSDSIRVTENAIINVEYDLKYNEMYSAKNSFKNEPSMDQYPVYLILGIIDSAILIKRMRDGVNWVFTTKFYTENYTLVGFLEIEYSTVSYFILDGKCVLRIKNNEKTELTQNEISKYFIEDRHMEIVAIFKKN